MMPLFVNYNRKNFFAIHKNSNCIYKISFFIFFFLQYSGTKSICKYGKRREEMLNLSLKTYIEDSYFPISVTTMTLENNLNCSQILLHSHDFSEIILIAEGGITHHCGSEIHSLKKGDFLLIHPGMKHAYSQMQKGTLIYNILYNSSVPIPMILLTKSPFLHLLYPGSGKGAAFAGILGNIRKRDLDKITFFLRTIRSELKTRRPGYQTIIISLFTAAVILLAYYCKAQNSPSQKWTLNTVIRMMNDHLGDSAFSIESLAKHSGMSMSALQRKFKQILGMRPSEYLQRLRVNRAISLLRETELTNDSIAFQCGFYNYSHMWKVFRKHLRCSPSAVRNGTAPEFHGTASAADAGKEAEAEPLREKGM